VSVRDCYTTAGSALAGPCTILMAILPLKFTDDSLGQSSKVALVEARVPLDQ
jgi:hypothetical protein